MSKQVRTRRPQAVPTPAASLPTFLAPVVHAGTHSGGQALDRHTNAEMSARFGHDFSQVRIHTDSRAEESAQEMGANAYTVGSDIVFGGGNYTPGSRDSERLLAHELTHVVQQARAGGGGDWGRMSAHGDASEREADALASQVMRGRTVDVQAGPDALVARDLFDDWKFSFVPKTSTDDTYDQRPGGAQDRDRKRQQEDDQQEAQRRGETDPRPKWWKGLFSPPSPKPLPALLPLTTETPTPVPAPSADMTPPAPSDTPAPHGPVPFAPDIKGAPNRYDKDDDQF